MIQFSHARMADAAGIQRPVVFAREPIARPILSPLQADTVTFGRDLSPKPERRDRRITVDSPALKEIADPAARAKAEHALAVMGDTLKELTDVYYSEWIRKFNDAKRGFENLVAQGWGAPAYDPAKAHKRIRHGKAHPVRFDVSLSHPNLLENRNLRAIDFGDVQLKGDAPLSLREARLEMANLHGFKAPKGSDFSGASFDRQTVFTPRSGLKKDMSLSNPRYETGPWSAYSNLFTDWPRSIVQRITRSWGLKRQPPKRYNLPGLP